jgi:cytochrome c553
MLWNCFKGFIMKQGTKKIIMMMSFFLLIFSQLSHADEKTNGKMKTQTCATCHGVSGDSPTNPLWPKLAHQNPKYLIKELLDFKLGDKGGRNASVMVELVKNLNDTDIKEIADYYAKLPRSLGVANPALVPLGERLYRGGDLQKGIPACAACHSPDGTGNPPAAFPALSGQHAEYVAEELKEFRRGTRNNDLNHMMRDISEKMSDEEIEAVSNYVAGLH